jgi:ABC-type glycerol-3-phosphate transport system substrate-binding protein
MLIALMVGPMFAADKPDKLVVWSFTPNNLKEIEDRKDVIEKKFGITLEMELLEGQAMMTRLRSAMTTGEDGPDIIDGYGDDVVLVGNPDPDMSMIIPLDEYVAKSDIADKIVPARMAKYNLGGHQYGLPNDVHPSVLIYNAEAWEAAGVDIEAIETWDEFFEAGKKVAVDNDGDGKQDVYPLMAAWYSVGQMILQQSGLRLEDEEGIPQINQPAFAAQMEKLYGWYEEGLIMDIDWAAVWDHIAAGHVLALTTPDWWFHDSVLNLAGTPVDGKMRARPLPVWEKGGPRTAAWGGSYKAVSIWCEYPEFAYQVAEEMNYGEGVAGPKYKSSGILMPIESAWDAEEIAAPNPVYGGQQTGLLQIELAKEMPVQEVFMFSAKGWGQINNAWTAVTSGEKDVQQALDDAQEELMREIEDYQM